MTSRLHVSACGTFRLGQVVQLNQDGLRWVRPTRRPARAAWPNREGVVKVIYRDQRVQVLWSGNKSLSDGVPLKFLAPVGAAMEHC